jgi:hypothetical protein
MLDHRGLSWRMAARVPLDIAHLEVALDAALLVPVTGSVDAGYAGAFTVNLDFGDGATTTTTPSTPDDTVVDARIARATVVRGKRRRVVRVVIRNDEKVTAKVRLVRGDTVLAKKTWGCCPRAAGS